MQCINILTIAAIDTVNLTHYSKVTYITLIVHSQYQTFRVIYGEIFRVTFVLNLIRKCQQSMALTSNRFRISEIGITMHHLLFHTTPLTNQSESTTTHWVQSQWHQTQIISN